MEAPSEPEFAPFVAVPSRVIAAKNAEASWSDRNAQGSRDARMLALDVRGHRETRGVAGPSAESLDEDTLPFVAARQLARDRLVAQPSESSSPLARGTAKVLAVEGAAGECSRLDQSSVDWACLERNISAEPSRRPSSEPVSSEPVSSDELGSGELGSDALRETGRFDWTFGAGPSLGFSAGLDDETAVPGGRAESAFPAGDTSGRSFTALPSTSVPRFAASARESTSVRVTHTAVLGPLARYAARPGVTDLFVNGDEGLWVDSGHGAEREPEWSLDEAEVRDLAVRLVALGGRHIDEATPCVDVRVGDGIRVHAVLPPVSSSGTLLSVRLPQAGGFDLEALARTGMFSSDGSGDGSSGGHAASDPPLLERLLRAVANRENVLVTGAAGSGKTTLLAAMLGAASPGERIVTIEDVAELRIAHPHVVGLEARQANLEGAGRLGLDSLLREALRMRPDRLVVGECRGAEIRELLAALNTGHDGGAGTLHANSLADVPARLEALGALAGMSAEAVARQTVSAIGLVLHLERRDGVRALGQPGRFALDESGRLTVVPEQAGRA